MRDPNLVSRAQRAAAVLERAWDQWRALHGLGAEPSPPVSSYVGYSLEEPWGQPRVVFGVPAEDAEQLAALLERHEWGDSAGPRHPGVTGGQWADSAPPAQMRRPAAAARPRVPGQAPAGPPERLRATGPAAVDARLAELPRADGMNGRGVPGDRADGMNGHGALGGHADGMNGRDALRGRADLTAQAGFRANGSDTGMAAFRPGAEPVPFPGEKSEPSPFADDDQAASGQAARRPRSHRHAAGHVVQHAARQKRASAAAEHDVVPLARPTVPPQAPSRRQGAQQGRDPRGSSAMAGDLAGWASGELPGQARRQPSWTVGTGPDLDDAEPASGETRRDNAI